MNKIGLAIFTATATAFMVCAYEMGKLKGYGEGYEIGWEIGNIDGQTTYLQKELNILKRS